MPAGSSPKREREYEKLKRGFKAQGRYRGREEEVAARVVNKQRSQYGETKAEKQKDRQGKSPDRGLPLRDYQGMTIADLKSHVGSLSAGDLRKLESYERSHKNRKGALALLRSRLH